MAHAQSVYIIRSAPFTPGGYSVLNATFTPGGYSLLCFETGKLAQGAQLGGLLVRRDLPAHSLSLNGNSAVVLAVRCLNIARPKPTRPCHASRETPPPPPYSEKLRARKTSRIRDKIPRIFRKWQRHLFPQALTSSQGTLEQNDLTELRREAGDANASLIHWGVSRRSPEACARLRHTVALTRRSGYPVYDTQSQ